MEASPWSNTTLVSGDLTKEVSSLKKQMGKDIIVYGGGEFVSSLISANLIDEYYLFVNPVALGGGMSIFKQRTNLQLAESIAFDCGITLLKYLPKSTE
ncbi:MAG: dihydrofolate reductase family protein [Bacteroidota bacterium]